MNTIGKVDGMPISLLSVKSNEIIVVQIDTDKWDLETCQQIYDNILSRVSPEVNFIGIPTGIELTVEQIDNYINYLLELKNDLLC